MSDNKISPRRAKLNIKESFNHVNRKYVPDSETGQPTDNMPHMTSAAYQAVDEITEALSSMTDEQIIGASIMLSLMNKYKSSAGYRRLFGYSLPVAAANLEVGPPPADS